MSETCKHEKPTVEKAYELTIKQLDHEINLVDQRLRWFLTFNGLIFTAFILTYRIQATGLVLSTAQFMFPVAGIVMSITIYRALRASEMARDQLKNYWNSMDNGYFPPAFSKGSGSEDGRTASISVPRIIGTMWLVMFIVVLLSSQSK